MKISVELSTQELRTAFAQGQRAARAGDRIQRNPFRPCSDGDLWRAWNLGHANRGKATLKKLRNRQNRAKAVVDRHGEICWLCQRPIANGDLTMDHILPRSKGGLAIRENLRPAHGKCNRERGNGPPPELLLRADMALPSPGLKPLVETAEIGSMAKPRKPEKRQNTYA